jgi:hypothetical protein
MSKLTVFAAAALLVAIGILAYVRLHQGPEKDLELTVAALGHVNSWHEEYEGPGGVIGTWDHSISDKLCPQGEHVIVDETDSASVMTHRENFYTAKNVYYRWPDRWVYVSSRGRVNDCSSAPHLDAVGIGLSLEDVLRGASVRAGNERMVGSEPCRDYHVKAVWREFIMCVNQTDHLPREIVSSLFKDESGQFVKPARATYSRWNSVTVSDFPEGFPKD